ncbi:class I SAM-dependent methyltransferase [Gordonia tangerina]|uniref:Methyltransferase domain-containing protein n=1 Tax=Gordonia tangerina TaxID=2911060 RepID=A0ABS9DH65_9ACTN|nr:class I SAM-dependent methyltransferase [Gordonia tangerina]MCF3938351.1 methyltransferase domain-containing protein [Gordonia tangerina]
MSTTTPSTTTPSTSTTTTSPSPGPTHSDDRPVTADAFAERIFTSALATAETMSIYLGERLGWYDCLVQHGPVSADELADRTGTHRRYAREWLEMQSAFGILDADLDADPIRFGIQPGVAEALTDTASLAYLGTLPRMFAASFGQLPALLDAYRTGGGVSWAELGADARECQAALNRPWFDRQLAPALAGVDGLHARLSRSGARIADVGFGAGYSTIALAKAYPEATFVGLDVDEASVQMARHAAAEAGVDDRVEFVLADASDAGQRGPFDVVFAFECVHDMPRPVEVLAAARAALAPDGVMVIMDEAVSDEFAGPADDLDKIMYAFSLFVCLPDGMSSTPSAGTGTVMRASTLRTYAQQAGFAEVEVLPIEEFSFFRFYQLTPG